MQAHTFCYPTSALVIYTVLYLLQVVVAAVGVAPAAGAADDGSDRGLLKMRLLRS